MQPNHKFRDDPMMFDELLQYRLVKYLYALRVPPVQALEVALSIMQDMGPFSDDAAVLRRGMEALDRQLAEKGFLSLPDWNEERAFSSVPSYNRGTMPPAAIDSGTRISRLWKRIRGGAKPE